MASVQMIRKYHEQFNLGLVKRMHQEVDDISNYGDNEMDTASEASMEDNNDLQSFCFENNDNYNPLDFRGAEIIDLCDSEDIIDLCDSDSDSDSEEEKEERIVQVIHPTTCGCDQCIWDILKINLNTIINFNEYLYENVVKDDIFFHVNSCLEYYNNLPLGELLDSVEDLSDDTINFVVAPLFQYNIQIKSKYNIQLFYDFNKNTNSKQ